MRVEEVSLDQRHLVEKVVDPLQVLGRSPPGHAEDLVALVKQELGQVRTVLAGDAGDQRTSSAHATLRAARTASSMSATVCSSGISGCHPDASRRREASPTMRGI